MDDKPQHAVPYILSRLTPSGKQHGGAQQIPHGYSNKYNGKPYTAIA